MLQMLVAALGNRSAPDDARLVEPGIVLAAPAVELLAHTAEFLHQAPPEQHRTATGALSRMHRFRCPAFLHASRARHHGTAVSGTEVVHGGPWNEAIQIPLPQFSDRM